MLVNQAQRTVFFPSSPALNLCLKVFTKLHDFSSKNTQFSSFWGGISPSDTPLCAQARHQFIPTNVEDGSTPLQSRLYTINFKLFKRKLKWLMIGIFAFFNKIESRKNETGLWKMAAQSSSYYAALKHWKNECHESLSRAITNYWTTCSIEIYWPTKHCSGRV